LSTYPVYINEKVWSEWPQQVRDLFAQVSAEAAERSVKAVSEAEAEAEVQMKKAGVTFHPFATQEELEKKLPNFMDLWIETMVQQGFGEQAKIVVANWRALLAKN
jgi:TRAP-type C4-dicarboxylate transport system substrate-binding protein